MSLKEAIRPIQPKKGGNTPVSEGLGAPMALFEMLIHNPFPKNPDAEIKEKPKKIQWPFDTGDPELWKFSSELIDPKGKALDLGSEFGRTSVPFALHGMNVTAYDKNPDFVKALNAVAENFDLPITVLNENATTADFGKEQFDTVILGKTFAHFESREEAFKVIDKAIKALKPGGRILFRGNGPGYDGLDGQTSSKDRNFDPFLDPEVYNSKEHYVNTCNCSGETGVVGHLFFDPLEVIQHMSERGIKIVHTQMVPQRGKTNIMYGEDWEPDRDYFDEDVSIDDILGAVFDELGERTYRGDDMITIIGQKINP